MPIPCPFCGHAARDLFALSLHLDDDHPGRERELVVAIASQPFPGVDIDAAHRTFGAISPAALARGQG